MQCLEKEPERRPQNAQELARMFRAAAGLSAQPTGGLNRFLWPAVAAACIGLVGTGCLAPCSSPRLSDRGDGTAQGTAPDPTKST